MDGMEQEPSLETAEEEIQLEPKKKFEIENHPEWKDIWSEVAHLPESHREALAPIIEAGNLSPDLWRLFNFKVTMAEQDKPVSTKPEYRDDARNIAAEVSYKHEHLTFFPETRDKPDQYYPKKITHIWSHELAHLLSTHLIDPKQYIDIITKRPSWTNGKYMQETAQKAPWSYWMEQIADDLGDYLKLKDKSPQAMVAMRLDRAGDTDAVHAQWEALSDNDKNALYAEAGQLIAFFDTMLDPERQNNPETALRETNRSKWFAMSRDIYAMYRLQHADAPELDESEFDMFAYEQMVPGDIGQTYAHTPQQKRKKQSWVDWLFRGKRE